MSDSHFRSTFPQSRRPRPSGAERRDVTAQVKWFNPTKGFGFVQPTDGSPDAFLHISVVEQSGIRDLVEGTVIVCDLTEGAKGPQVSAIHRVESAPAAPPRGRGSYGGGGPGYGAGGRGGGGETVEGTVKFFNADKGFGFVTPDNGGNDVFVSARTLERTGLTTLEAEQRVRLSVRQGQKGPMAESIEVV